MIAPRIRRGPAVVFLRSLFLGAMGAVFEELVRFSVPGVVAVGVPGRDPERCPETNVDSDLEVSYTRTCEGGAQAIWLQIKTAASRNVWTFEPGA
jgi:hypothetical protein